GTKALNKLDGIIVPQGWGSRGSEGKIKTIKYCRENNKPYFGLCYGMQMAVIEFARNVCGLKDANSEEVAPKTAHPVIHIMPGQKEMIAKKQYGGTIRLGGWPCKIIDKTRMAKAYGRGAGIGDKKIVSERHRHRYEFNNKYREILEKNGLTVAGASPDGKIVEAVEITKHPFFIGTQFHPEYISRPLNPHPLFVEFIKVCLKLKK
ncbi:MAG: gamma-glutamyl-gamma-aminobutyrate hydrolase family protein, partial [Candidatus Falkowbacteria bacterium]